MNEQKYTNKVIEAINETTNISKDKKLPSIDIPVFLRVIYDQENSMYLNILKKLNIDVKQVSFIIDNAISSSTTTSSTEIDTSSDFKKLLYNATKYQKEFEDDYMSIEHLILAHFDTSHSIVARLKKEFADYNKNRFKEVIKTIRGNNHVTSDTPESQYEALSKYGRDLVVDVASGKIDPVIGRDQEIRRVMEILSRKSKNNKRG